MTQSWSEAKCAGYALAALIAGDRAIEAADALPQAVAAHTRALIAHDGGERGKQARRELVGHLLSAVRPEVTLDERTPTRVRALLATRMPRGRVRALGLPAPRAGFTVPEDLWPRLYRIARYHAALEREDES